MGGEAYGMPLNTSTAPRFRLKFSNCTIVPVTWPYFVWTIREVICAWSLGVEESLSSPPDEESGSSVIINATSNIFTSQWHQGYFKNIKNHFLWFFFIQIFWNKNHTHILHMFQFTWNISTLLFAYWLVFDILFDSFLMIANDFREEEIFYIFFPR